MENMLKEKFSYYVLGVDIGGTNTNLSIAGIKNLKPTLLFSHNYITNEFGKRIKDLYSPEDVKRGYIESVSRQEKAMKFPIMTISLAGVTNQFKDISSYAEVTNTTAEVKHKAKSVTGSTFILDKRLG